MPTPDWDPQQYARFAAERRQPFDELLALLRPVSGGRVADLGCGPGPLTVELHHALGAAETLGIDNSPAMLAEAQGCAVEGVTFAAGDLSTWAGEGSTWDVIVAAASLQWVGDHAGVLAHWRDALAPGGQLAVQVPANRDHPAHVLIDEVAADLGLTLPPDHLGGVLAPERYAEVLHDLGFVDQHVRLQVFGHVLHSTDEVVEWTKGTALTRVRKATTPEEHDHFLTEYRTRLLAALGDHQPYFYAFKRILFWAVL